MDGDGKLCRHEIGPLSIHYTNAWTGYGLIVAGDKGMSYYVMRPGFDVLGYQYLHVPESRNYLTRGGKRFLLAEKSVRKPKDELRKLAALQTERVIEVGAGDPDADMFSHVVSMGPDISFTGPDPRLGGGQVLLVLEGSMVYEGSELGLRGAVAVTNVEGPVTVLSGADGLQFLHLQYALR
jgi:hypothetical protein